MMGRLKLGLSFVFVPVLCTFFAVNGGAHGKEFPEAMLRAAFPEAKSFVSRQVKFTAAQLEQLRSLSVTLDSEEQPLTVYVALGPGSSIGLALSVHSRGPKGLIDMLVAYGMDGKIRKIQVEGNGGEPGVAAEDFLKQFYGKGLSTPLNLGKDVIYKGDQKVALLFTQSVRRAFLLLRAAFPQTFGS